MPASGQTKTYPNIILITVDTLRADHLPMYGYARDTAPSLRNWSKGAAIFENAYATMGSTAQSVTSILSGLYPQDHGVRLLYQLAPPGLRLVTDYLPAAARYERAAFVSNLCLTAEAAGLHRYFDYYDDYVDRSEPYRRVFERNAEDTTDAVLRWLETKRDRHRPLFLWVHYIDPHGPYHPPSTWKRKFHHDRPQIVDIEKIPDYEREPGNADALDYVDRYDEEIRYTDRHIGRLLDYLSARNLNDSIVIFTADHGESMMEHERWFTHQYHVYNEIVRVPLMIAGPGIRSSRISAAVSGIDVAPTVLSSLGAPVPATMRGVDLRKPVDANRVVFTEDGYDGSAEWRAAIAGTQKLVLHGKLDANGVPNYDEKRWYDLAADPKELHPKSWPKSDAMAALLMQQAATDPAPLGILVAATRGVARSAPKIDPRADPETLKKLKALGYVNH